MCLAIELYYSNLHSTMLSVWRALRSLTASARLLREYYTILYRWLRLWRLALSRPPISSLLSLSALRDGTGKMRCVSQKKDSPFYLEKQRFHGRRRHHHHPLGSARLGHSSSLLLGSRDESASFSVRIGEGGGVSQSMKRLCNRNCSPGSCSSKDVSIGSGSTFGAKSVQQIAQQEGRKEGDAHLPFLELH